MPWCPKCKNEYREGITTCSECKVELVESFGDIIETSYEELVSSENKEKLEKFIEYLDYSGITSHTLTSDEYNLVWTVSVAESDIKKAKKLFKGFAITESEMGVENEIKTMLNDMQTDEDAETDDTKDTTSDNEYLDFDEAFSDSSASNDDASSDDNNDFYNEINEDEPDSPEVISKSYVRKADQYKEYQFSALTCVIVGLIGDIFCMFNMLGIFNYVSVLFSQIVLLVVFTLFLIGGIAMYVKSNSIKAEIGAQTDSENEIKEWLNTNITNEYIESIKDPEATDEINYFNCNSATKEKLLNSIPNADISMVEALVDEHLESLDI